MCPTLQALLGSALNSSAMRVKPVRPAPPVPVVDVQLEQVEAAVPRADGEAAPPQEVAKRRAVAAGQLGEHRLDELLVGRRAHVTPPLARMISPITALLAAEPRKRRSRRLVGLLRQLLGLPHARSRRCTGRRGAPRTGAA